MHAVYVALDCEKRQQFQAIACECTELDSLNLFANADEVQEWADKHFVDIAFVDADALGVRAAEQLIQSISNVRVVLIASDERYAMDAWRIGASGYLVSPCTTEDVRKELDKCWFRLIPSQRVVIHTIPSFSVVVNGNPLYIAGSKPKELFALLVECGQRGLTTAEGISYLWPDKENDEKTQSLFRMTYKRLQNALDAAGVGDIIESRDHQRFIRVDRVTCDLYLILSGDVRMQKLYAGQYLQEYSWAEERNAQLYGMLLNK
ncbi:MAG: hypothetical protein J6K55_16210 [Clostridia bacterium]|nr:hypothetical protein [Clostridia bacterium]